jgi:hypothetical protein
LVNYSDYQSIQSAPSGGLQEADRVSDILDATSYNHDADPITDWVEITTSGSDSVVKIDRDGTGGTYSMTQVATLQGITGLTDEAALVTSGNLLAA